MIGVLWNRRRRPPPFHLPPLLFLLLRQLYLADSVRDFVNNANNNTAATFLHRFHPHLLHSMLESGLRHNPGVNLVLCLIGTRCNLKLERLAEFKLPQLNECIINEIYYTIFFGVLLTFFQPV